MLNKVPDKAVFFVTPVSNSDVDACIELKSYTEDIVNFIKAVDPGPHALHSAHNPYTLHNLLSLHSLHDLHNLNGLST